MLRSRTVSCKHASVAVAGLHCGKSRETFFARRVMASGLILRDLNGSYSLFSRGIKSGGQHILKQRIKTYKS